MEPNDILRWLVALLALISLGAVGLVTYALLGSLRRRRALRSREQPGAAAPAAEKISSVSAARLPQPPILPELMSEAADTPRDERLINAAASTMKTLSPGMQDAVWVAVVPRQFNVELLTALRPDWGALTNDVYERLARLWFVSAMPEGSACDRPFAAPCCASLPQGRPAKIPAPFAARRQPFHARMVNQSDAYSQRNARSFRDILPFLPPNRQSPGDEIEWLYHLAVADRLAPSQFATCGR
jgi:hypothetical protein